MASLRAVLLVAAALAAVGAVVALAAFVLFRAGQILLGNENPSGTVTGATGLFLLAFLGLVSGLSYVARSILRLENTPLA